MYDVLTSQFNDALARESKIVTDSTGNTSYTCLFRKNSDKNTSDNRLTIFYPVSEAIAQGQLLKYGGRYFLTLNQKTIENATYQKSDLLETNTGIYTIVRDSSSGTGYELNLRAYSEDLTSVGLTGDSTISIVGGNISFITQDDANSRNLAIDATFSALGATWKIINIYYKSGICYIYTERSASSTSNPVYSLAITGGDSVTMEDVAQLVATATITDGSTTTTILNPTINWTSSDTSLATVSSTGLVTGIAEGNVTVNATWAEHNVSATHGMEVKSNVVITYNVTISGRTTIRTGTGYNFSAVFTDSSGNVVSLSPVWSHVVSDASLSSYVTGTVNADGTYRIAAANNDDLCGCTCTISVKDSNNLCAGSYTTEFV
jgi:Bacterial Ig-like domain (group 2).